MLTPLYNGHFEENGYYIGSDAKDLFVELLTGKTRKQQLRYLREATIEGLLADLTAQGRKVRVCEHCGFVIEYKRSTKRFCRSCMQREQDNKRSNTRKEARAEVSPKRFKAPHKQVDEGREEYTLSNGEVIIVYWNEHKWAQKYRSYERPLSTELLTALYGAEDSNFAHISVVWDEAIGEQGEYVPTREDDAEAVYEGRDDVAVKRIEAYWLEFELTTR